MVAKGGGVAKTTRITKKLKALAKNTGQKGKKCYIQPRRSVMSGICSLLEANSGNPSE